ncbi:MAG: hypothetical protein MUC82_05415 [Cypionkella sp.]|jgi:hypothetical protein|nr:hypothetical protein [Cypionkella sp.]
MRCLAFAALLSCLAAPAVATEGALPQDAATDLAFAESTKWCADQGGTLRRPESPATSVDLTGDGSADDWIISESGAFCGPDLGYLGGSGGAMLHAVIGSTVSSWLGGAWHVQDLVLRLDGEDLPSRRVLLLGLHGAFCDSFGAAPCLVALSWDGERLIHYAPEGVADTPPATEP